MVADALNTRECIVIPSDYVSQGVNLLSDAWSIQLMDKRPRIQCTLLPIPPLLLQTLNQIRIPMMTKDGEKPLFPLLDETQTLAMVLVDVTRCSPSITFPRKDRVVSIEIKPKWAFSPSLMINLPNAGDLVCRNCAYERYKNSSVTKPLPCLLRLYSSSVMVVAMCLQELLDRGKAKLFVNGVKEDVKGGNLEFPVSMQEVQAAASALIQSGTMDRLSQQQALRDHELDAIYADYMAHFQSTEHNYRMPQAVKYRVADYLLCATLRDVSVFITLSDRPICKDSLQVPSSGTGDLNLNYWYTIRVVDLDRKSPRKIPFYWERHQKVLDFWRSESSIQHSCYASSFSEWSPN